MGVRFSPAFVCLSVCLISMISQNGCSQDHKTWHRNVPPRVLETHLFWDQRSKVNVTRHKKTVPAWRFALLRVLASSTLNLLLYCLANKFPLFSKVAFIYRYGVFVILAPWYESARLLTYLFTHTRINVSTCVCTLMRLRWRRSILWGMAIGMISLG